MRHSLSSDICVISGWGGLCALGVGADQVNNSFSRGVLEPFNISGVPVLTLSPESEEILNHQIEKLNLRYDFDRHVIMALKAAGDAVDLARLNSMQQSLSCLFGTSRGGTSLWEKYHGEYLANENNKISNLSSPLTTFGNLSSTVAQTLGCNSLALDLSMTCSSGLNAVVQGLAFLKAGFARSVLVGGSEAPVTDFTVAQMRALGIYSRHKDGIPCRPCSLKDEDYNSFVLGEGAGAFVLESYNPERLAHYQSFKCPILLGVGWGQEKISELTEISEAGFAFSLAMKRALAGVPTDTKIDAIFMHAPGTRLGDKAELNAIEAVFGDDKPALLSNKFLIGHSFGASGSLSMLNAIGMLQGAQAPDIPYESMLRSQASTPKTIMINAAGFGGNAVSIILQLPEW